MGLGSEKGQVCPARPSVAVAIAWRVVRCSCRKINCMKLLLRKRNKRKAEYYC